MWRLRNHLGFDLGKRLRQLRTARGLSPEDLARQTGFYAFHITEVETGAAAPSLPNLEKWAKALGIELWQLFLEGDQNGSCPGTAGTRCNPAMHCMTASQDSCGSTCSLSPEGRRRLACWAGRGCRRRRGLGKRPCRGTWERRSHHSCSWRWRSMTRHK